MKKWLLIVCLSALLNADDSIKKAVFDLTTGDSKLFERMILSGIPVHKTYFESKMEELEVVVVIHGDAYKFFLKNLASSPYKNDKELGKVHEMLGKRLVSSSENYKVNFLMCESGMKKLHIAKENVYDFVTLIPTSTIGLIEKQNEGYAYIPVR